ncbi:MULTISPECIES: carbohydrate ABC transporter permease [unclassified Plantibacter]|jgi:putative aldouronate transport system permease protein|uniref:carbohydrate ABC transporter permease n=1 Tax=unclassified Plantibacter TaxID=2624265 RepID=UPI003D349942
MTTPSHEPDDRAAKRTGAGGRTTLERKRPRNRIQGGQTPAPVPMRILKGIVLTIICAIIVMPFVGMIATSVAPAEQVMKASGLVFIPESIDFSAYQAIFAGGVVTRSLGVSVFVTLVGTAIALTITSLLAYALARPRLPGRRTFMILLLVSLLFTPGMIPMYLAVKQYGLIDSIWALIIPVTVNAFNVVVMRAFFQGIPQELIDSALIDGASEWQIFRRIVLPLSKAIMAVIGLFYAVGFWNSFFSALLYINDQSMWPLQLVLRTFVVNEQPLALTDLPADLIPAQPTIQMALLVIALLPIVVVYPFLQKHFAKGVLTGAVKG